MKRLKILTVFFLSVTLVYSATLVAAEIEWNGFLTASVSKSDSKSIFQGGIKDEYNYSHDSLAGLSATYAISSMWESHFLIIGKENGSEDLDLEIDLAQVSFRPSDNWTFRVGKLRLPTWMISEYINIKMLYPWNRAPDEVYQLNPVNSFMGGFASYRVPLTSSWNLSFDLFTGSADYKIETQTSGYSSPTVENKRRINEGMAKNHKGVNLKLFNNYLLYRLSYVKTNITSDIHSIVEVTDAATGVKTQSIITTPFDLGRSTFFSTGLKLDYKSLMIMGEYVEFESSSDLFKEVCSYYATLGLYLFNKKLLPHLTHSQMTKKKSTFSNGLQKSLIAGLNYSINHDLLLKADWQRVTTKRGEANFSQDPNRPVNIYGLSLNMVF
jgi:hypothetical protein